MVQDISTPVLSKTVPPPLAIYMLSLCHDRLLLDARQIAHDAAGGATQDDAFTCFGGYTYGADAHNEISICWEGGTQSTLGYEKSVNSPGSACNTWLVIICCMYIVLIQLCVLV